MGPDESYESQLYFCIDDGSGAYERLTFSHATLDADIEETPTNNCFGTADATSYKKRFPSNS